MSSEPIRDYPLEAAAERTRAFLYEMRRAHNAGGNMDPNIIYSLGGSDGIVDLTFEDLAALVRQVLPSADLGENTPVRKRVRIDYSKVLEAERRYAAAEGDDGED